MKLARQVRHDHDGAAQDTHDEEVLARVVAVDFFGHVAEPAVHILGGHQDLFEVVSHVGGVHRVLFSCVATRAIPL